jgi:hypothetical protein
VLGPDVAIVKNSGTEGYVLIQDGEQIRVFPPTPLPPDTVCAADLVVVVPLTPDTTAVGAVLMGSGPPAPCTYDSG